MYFSNHGLCGRTWLAYYGNIPSCLEMLPSNPWKHSKPNILSELLVGKGIIKNISEKKNYKVCSWARQQRILCSVTVPLHHLSYRISRAARFLTGSLVSKSKQLNKEGDLQRSRPRCQRTEPLSSTEVWSRSLPWWSAASHQRQLW